MTIKQFFLSPFWTNRYLKRIKEEGLLNQLSKILKAIIYPEIIYYYGDKKSDGRSYGNTIELNINKFEWKKDSEYSENTLMHEYGHLQYLHKDFKQVVLLNDLIILTPSPSLLKTDSYYKYITDSNEIRLRIIPIIKTMAENNWTSKETYNRTCKYDDIFNFYDKDLIIYWIDNLL